MHPCLCVDEILRLVFRCIEDRSTLCALARTCRAFHNPATDLIWETLTAMEPILQHLSPARLVPKATGSYIKLSHSLSDDDWNIVRRLSSCVRRFHIVLEQHVPLHGAITNAVPQWFCFLTSPPDPSFLFPNLRSLSYRVDRYLDKRGTENIHAETSEAVILFFHLLLGPHLSALRFEMPGTFYSHLDISSIPVLCPNIHTLNIGGRNLNWGGFQIPDEALYQFSRVVSELSHLETVRSYETSWELLSSLAQAKRLRRLLLLLPNRLGPGPDLPSHNIFLQLRTLYIRADSHTSCTDLFRWTSFNEVNEIYVECSLPVNSVHSLQALVDMSSLISLQCKHLEFLWIFSLYHDFDTPTAWPRPMLEPYQSFYQLRVVALQTSFSLALADNDFEDMVKAWPHLEVFHLFHDGIMSPPVHLTLRGVTALLHHCPKLKHFTLMFDATHVPERVTPLSRSTVVRNTAVKYMGVYTSPVSESSDVAAYLSILMPYLRVIGVETGRWVWAWLVLDVYPASTEACFEGGHNTDEIILSPNC
ncbi:hypothetical protein EDC04DRAFT_1223582 [Pisolithus marmoratus]|nr:hypothetical protein EDC04DRAFT_1223582 [Pisolithus marmoratus]